jgi:NDP-sugar pyrophosphorylase family protein
MKKAIILAGGEGVRLRPITYEIPKPLIPVKKKPLINHIISFFERSGISEIGIIISKKDIVDFQVWKKNWKDHFSITINLFVKEPRVETFSGLRVIKDWVGDESFIVANGDCLIDFDFASLRKFHKLHKPIISVPLLNVNTSGDYGECVLSGIYVKKFFIRKVTARKTLISGGPYIFNPIIFKYDDLENDFLNIERNIFSKLIKEKKIIAIKIKKSRFFDCGTLKNWEKAIREW